MQMSKKGRVWSAPCSYRIKRRCEVWNVARAATLESTSASKGRISEYSTLSKVVRSFRTESNEMNCSYSFVRNIVISHEN